MHRIIEESIVWDAIIYGFDIYDQVTTVFGFLALFVIISCHNYNCPRNASSTFDMAENIEYGWAGSMYAQNEEKILQKVDSTMGTLQAKYARVFGKENHDLEEGVAMSQVCIIVLREKFSRAQRRRKMFVQCFV